MMLRTQIFDTRTEPIQIMTNPDRTELFDLNIEPEPEFHNKYKRFKFI